MYIWNDCLITDYNVKDVPVTDLVIKSVEVMSSGQGTKTLKIKSRKKVPLQPDSWITGVEYNNAHDKNEREDKEYKY